MSRRYLAFSEICTSSYDTFKDKVENMKNFEIKQTYIRMRDVCTKVSDNNLLIEISNLKSKYELICNVMKSRGMNI